MNVSHRFIGLFLALPVAVSLVGCGGSDKIATVPVKGTVAYQGKPVEGAAVMFSPAQGPSATAETNANGEFTLKTQTQDGAVTGEHVVTISKVVSPPAGAGDLGRVPPDTNPAPPKSLIPRKYSDPQASGLKKTVTKSGANEFAFELTD